ncbi:MAG: HipA N-terminal domain-containing protein, partial [Bdellovibrio sp.]
MKVLYVFFGRLLVGELRLLREERYEFQYSSTWLENQQAFPIAFLLQLQQEPHLHQVTKSFFEGLIPEGDFLRQIESRSPKPIGSAFDFLAYYGRDCAGALTIQAQDFLPRESVEDLIPISWRELSRAIRDH